MGTSRCLSFLIFVCFFLVVFGIPLADKEEGQVKPRFLPNPFGKMFFFSRSPKVFRTSRTGVSSADPTRSTILALSVTNPIRTLIQRASNVVTKAFGNVRDGFINRASILSDYYSGEEPVKTPVYSNGGFIKDPTTKPPAHSAVTYPVRKNKPKKGSSGEGTKKYQPINPFLITAEEGIRKGNNKKDKYNTVYSIKDAGIQDVYEGNKFTNDDESNSQGSNSLSILHNLYNRIRERTISSPASFFSLF